jgi:hypothetical protein
MRRQINFTTAQDRKRDALLAILEAQIEAEADSGKEAKDRLSRAKADYLAAKARIRAEIP